MNINNKTETSLELKKSSKMGTINNNLLEKDINT